MKPVRGRISSPIKSWQKFGRIVRSRGCSLLARLDNFPDSILVSGCQRSGTTILSRVIAQGDGMEDFRFGPDDELDAALILSGEVDYVAQQRCCFQTTYLNECYPEYYQHRGGFRLIWVHRNPYSVVYSLLHNWKRFALNELFRSCGISQLTQRDQKIYERFDVWAFGRLRRACYSYNAKVSQLFDLSKNIDAEHLLVLDYEDLVRNKNRMLPEIYRFSGLLYKPEYANKIHSRSLDKAARLSRREKVMIDRLCMPVDRKIRSEILDHHAI